VGQNIILLWSTPELTLGTIELLAWSAVIYSLTEALSENTSVYVARALRTSLSAAVKLMSSRVWRPRVVQSLMLAESVEDIGAAFVVKDSSGQKLGYGGATLLFVTAPGGLRL